VTLLAALARLTDIEAIINASSDVVSTSLAKLQGNIVALANTSQALTTRLDEQAKTSKLLTEDRMDKHASQLANLLDLKKA
jgi:hypothetical protein